MVVEITGGSVGTVMAAQDGSYQLFGSCLSVAARDGKQRYVKLPAVVLCQMLKRQQAVLHDYIALIPGHYNIGRVNNCIGGAHLKGSGSKLVAVELFPPKGKVNFSPLHSAAIGCNAGMSFKQLV